MVAPTELVAEGPENEGEALAPKPKKKKAKKKAKQQSKGAIFSKDDQVNKLLNLLRNLAKDGKLRSEVRTQQDLRDWKNIIDGHRQRLQKKGGRTRNDANKMYELLTQFRNGSDKTLSKNADILLSGIHTVREYDKLARKAEKWAAEKDDTVKTLINTLEYQAQYERYHEKANRMPHAARNALFKRAPSDPADFKK